MGDHAMPWNEKTPLVSKATKVNSAGLPINPEEYDEESCCDLREVGLAYSQPWQKLFSTNACCSPVPFFVWRFALFSTMMAVTVWCFLDWSSPKKYWWTKLTHWGLLVELAYFFFVMISSYGAMKYDGFEVRTPWYVSVAACLQVIMLPVSLLIVALYWGLVWDGSTTDVLTVVTHGVNFVLMLVDLFASRQPLRLIQVMWPVIFGFIYVLFSYVYYVSGGTFEDGVSPYIYSALNWKEHPMNALGMGSAIVFLAIPLIFLVLWGIKKIRWH